MKELIDQPAHAIAAMVLLVPAMLWPSVWSFAWAGFGAGVVREVTETGTPFTLGKLVYSVRSSWLDLTFWTIGAAVAAVVIGV